MTKKEDLSYREQMIVARQLARERLPRLNEGLVVPQPPQTFYARYGKRILDIVLSLLACLITLPINAILALCTFFDVGRPIVFTQTRVGKDGTLFRFAKFRNMTNECDDRGELLPAEQRVTKFGQFMRRSSLDELSNFWFILKGDMSFIGPRPLIPDYTDLYNARHKARLLVKPGLECPPHDYQGDSRSWQSRFDNDAWYVENLSFKTDCKLIWNLVKLACNPEDSAMRSKGSEVGTFLGYTEEGVAMTVKDLTQEEIDRVLGDDASEH